MSADHPRKILLQFLGTCLAAGSGYFFIANALPGMNESQIVATRMGLGAATLAIGGAWAVRWPRHWRAWLHLFVLALVNVAVFLLWAWSQRHVSSGLASIYNAGSPLMTVLFAVAIFRVERLSIARACGLAVGLAGILIVLRPWESTVGGNLAGNVACVLAISCYGFTLAYIRRFHLAQHFPGASLPMATLAVGAMATIAIFPTTVFQPVHLSTPVVVSILTLGVAGTGFAVLWNFNVLSAWGPTAASSVTYLAPVVGLLLGTLLLNEKIEPAHVLGGAVTIAGAVLMTSRRRGSRAPDPQI